MPPSWPSTEGKTALCSVYSPQFFQTPEKHDSKCIEWDTLSDLSKPNREAPHSSFAVGIALGTMTEIILFFFFFWPLQNASRKSRLLS